jgi:zinc-ribbon domain
MRFACQSCGKAYNLPEEKIADKSNVKLKCRVCGAIVEVKKQGEVVASMLGEGEIKRGRVSEAPAPLTSMMPDDSDDATHAIAVSDQILAEGVSGDDAASALMGHVKSALGQRGLAPLPPPAPTGFGAPPLTGFGSPSASGFGSPPPPQFGQGAPPGFAPTPVPPPLSVPDLPRAEPPTFARPDASAAPPLPPSLGSGPGSPPPPLPNAELGLHASGSHGMGSLQNGSNGAASRFGDAAMSDDPMPPQMASLGMSAAGAMSMGAGAMSMGGAAAMSASTLGSGDMGSYSGPAPADMQPPAQASDATRKMLAALATGILIGFIIARLFF